MLTPIPRSALSQEIIINGTTYTNVLIEPITSVVSSVYGMQQQSNYLLMIDKVNTPSYETIKTLIDVQTTIIFDGKNHTVTSKEVLYDRLTKNEHHLEVRLT